MRFAPVRLLTNGNMATSINSNGEDLNQIFMYSIQAIWTGAPVGSLKLQVSNDDVPSAPVGNATPGTAQANVSSNVVNWTDYTGSTTAVSGPGDFMWIVSDGGYKWVRVVYTATSGTGSLTVEYNGKGG